MKRVLRGTSGSDEVGGLIIRSRTSLPARSPVLPKGAQLHVEHLLVKDDQAVVELHSLATAKNGMRFDNRYCWVCTFESKVITRVRA